MYLKGVEKVAHNTLQENVTLPPEMSRIATGSVLGYSQFPKGGAILSSLTFQLNQFLQSFLNQKKYTCRWNVDKRSLVCV